MACLNSDVFAETTEIAIKSVKHGFIHFHNPADVTAVKQNRSLSRSASCPRLDGNGLGHDNATAGDHSSADKYVSAPTTVACTLIEADFNKPAIAGKQMVAKDVATLSPSALALRTPSTTCSSPHSARWSPCLDTRSGPAAEKVVSSLQSVRKPPRQPRAPFASLLLPTWAMEKAANAEPPTDFGDLQSWYSDSPRSTPSSSPAASPTSSPAASYRFPCSMPAVSWADLAEEDDEDSTATSFESLLKAAVPSDFEVTRSRFFTGSEVEDQSSASPFFTPAASPEISMQGNNFCRNVLWADLVDDSE